MAFKNPALIDFQAESLVVAATAALRKLFSVVANTAVPTLATDGFECRRFSQLRFTFNTTGGAGSTADYSVYWFSLASQLWVLDTSIGTAGVATVTLAAGNYQPILLTGAADRCYVRVTGIGGAGVPTADAWAEGNQ